MTTSEPENINYCRSYVNDEDMIFGQEIGLDRMHSQGDVKAKLIKQEDTRSEQLTPFFKKLSPADSSQRASDSRRPGALTDKSNEKLYLGLSVESMDSNISDMDPLAKCLSEIQSSENESMGSFKSQSAQRKSTLTAKDFQIVNVIGPGIVKPTILEACFDAIDEKPVNMTQSAAKQLNVEYIKSSFSKLGRNSVMVPVEESLRRQQDIFGRKFVLRQPDLRDEYTLRTENPQNYDSDSSMSENEEYEIDSKSAPSLSLSRQPCGLFKRFDVAFAGL